LEPGTSESRSKAIKTRIKTWSPKKIWATKTARFVDSQGMMTSSKCKQICINI